MSKRSRDKAELAKLLDELQEIKTQLTGAYNEFNNSIEPEMIEASIYQINALQSRYSYTLRNIKSYKNTKVESFAFPKKSEVGAVKGDAL